MPDRIVEAEQPTEVPDIDPTLLGVLEKAIEEAQATLANEKDIVPFTAVYVKGTAFIEEHDAPTTEECYNMAFHTVKNVSGAQAYAFCYDGFIDSSEGQLDAIIAEGGVPGKLEGYAIAQVYEIEDDVIEFIGEPAYLGPAPNFMVLTPTEPYQPPAQDADGETAPEDGETPEDSVESGQ